MLWGYIQHIRYRFKDIPPEEPTEEKKIFNPDDIKYN